MSVFEGTFSAGRVLTENDSYFFLSAFLPVSLNGAMYLLFYCKKNFDAIEVEWGEG